MPVQILVSFCFWCNGEGKINRVKEFHSAVSYYLLQTNFNTGILKAGCFKKLYPISLILWVVGLPIV